MADLEIPTNQREFICEHCEGKISVPLDLPPTTGPCPYCSGTITSPAPEKPKVPTPEPNLPLPLAKILPPTPTREIEKIAEKPQPQLPEPSIPEEPQTLTRPRTGLASKVLALLTLILLGSATAYFALKKPVQPIKPPVLQAATSTEVDYLRTGWQKDANQLLHSYLATKSTDEKLPLILNAALLKTTVGEFYTSGTLHDSDISADSFVVNELTEEDRQRGLFMMVSPPPNAKDASKLPTIPRVHAFFKRTPDGLKLDWEIFAQTKYRTLHKFIDQPKVGQTGIFRVLVMADLPNKAKAMEGKATYQMADPANPGDGARVSVKLESDAGKTLSLVNWIGAEKARTATVELRWAGLTTAPELMINRLICWEFLGLGGRELPAPPALK